MNKDPVKFETLHEGNRFTFVNFPQDGQYMVTGKRSAFSYQDGYIYPTEPDEMVIPVLYMNYGHPSP